jgi:hypothetical protein
MAYLVMWVVIALGASIIAVVRGTHQARRRATLIRLSHAVGLEYAANDLFDDLWEPFPLFGKGDARGIRNVMYGTRGGVEVRAFDYWYRRGADRDRGVALPLIGGPIGLAAWIGFTRRFSCAVAALPGSCPRLVVEPKGMSGRVMELVTAEVPLESEEFTRRFHVRCDDSRFAVAFLDPRVMETLLAVPGRPTLMLAENRMLLVTRALRPAELIGLAQEVSELARRVPRVLASLYPLRPGFRPEDGRPLPRSLRF